MNQAEQSYARAVTLHLEGKGGQALAELQRALEEKEKLSGANLAQIYSAVGYLRFEARQFEEAVEAYGKLLAVDSKHPSVCFNLALSLEALGRWQLAAEQVEKALAIDPERQQARLGLGACCLQLGAGPLALESYEHCLRRDSELEAAQFGKAVALQLQKKFAEAAGIYGRILEKNPRSGECLTNAIAVRGG